MMSSPIVGSSSMTPQHFAVRTPIERARTRWEKESSSEDKSIILKDLFLKHRFSWEDVQFSSSGSIKLMVLGVLELAIIPPTDQEFHNLTHNINVLGTELLTKRVIEILPHEKMLLESHLKNIIGFPSILKSSTNSSTQGSTSCEALENTGDAAIEFFKQNPINWLLFVLNPHINIWSFDEWSSCIHPHVLILCYKSCIGTEEFLDHIINALQMQIFSVREDAKLKRNLLDLISTWLRSRYYINELSRKSVKDRFEVIFQYYSTVPDEGIRGEFEILKVLHKNSQSITPRERISLSIASFNDFIKELQYIKKSDDFQRWYKTLVHEITSFFMSYLVNIPTDEYFLKFTSNAPSQHFSEFFEAVNKLESFLKNKFASFTGHDAVRYYEALINAITIANEERLYQTAFTLKHVLDS